MYKNWQIYVDMNCKYIGKISRKHSLTVFGRKKFSGLLVFENALYYADTYSIVLVVKVQQ